MLFDEQYARKSGWLWPSARAKIQAAAAGWCCWWFVAVVVRVSPPRLLLLLPLCSLIRSVSSRSRIDKRSNDGRRSTQLTRLVQVSLGFRPTHSLTTQSALRLALPRSSMATAATMLTSSLFLSCSVLTAAATATLPSLTHCFLVHLLTHQLTHLLTQYSSSDGHGGGDGGGRNSNGDRLVVCHHRLVSAAAGVDHNSL